MKVVINTCFGGFELSTEAMKRAIAEGARGIEVCDEKEYTNNKKGKREKFRDVGGGYKVGKLGAVLYKDGKVYTFNSFNNDARSDPVLVRIVEEMGSAANGEYSELKVVEIPDNIEWIIVDYGNEHVAEKHRTWA